jgi:hypothetical protein
MQNPGVYWVFNSVFSLFLILKNRSLLTFQFWFDNNFGKFLQRFVVAGILVEEPKAWRAWRHRCKNAKAALEKSA